jgi:hypothetical protein
MKRIRNPISTFTTGEVPLRPAGGAIIITIGGGIT